ncbi:uncharacterized protein LOC144179786 [Haemaphysalis longicornis]
MPFVQQQQQQQQHLPPAAGRTDPRKNKTDSHPCLGTCILHKQQQQQERRDERNLAAGQTEALLVGSALHSGLFHSSAAVLQLQQRGGDRAFGRQRSPPRERLEWRAPRQREGGPEFAQTRAHRAKLSIPQTTCPLPPALPARFSLRDSAGGGAFLRSFGPLPPPPLLTPLRSNFTRCRKHLRCGQAPSLAQLASTRRSAVENVRRRVRKARGRDAASIAAAAARAARAARAIFLLSCVLRRDPRAAILEAPAPREAETQPEFRCPRVPPAETRVAGAVSYTYPGHRPIKVVQGASDRWRHQERRLFLFSNGGWRIARGPVIRYLQSIAVQADPQATA